MAVLTAATADYHKLDIIVRDLKQIQADFLGEQRNELRELECKGFDVFELHKHRLNVHLADLRQSIDRLVDIKRNLPAGHDRNATTIRLESHHRSELAEAVTLFDEMRSSLDKTGTHLDAQKLADRKHMVTVLAQEIQLLTQKNARVQPAALPVASGLSGDRGDIGIGIGIGSGSAMDPDGGSGDPIGSAAGIGLGLGGDVAAPGGKRGSRRDRHRRSQQQPRGGRRGSDGPSPGGSDVEMTAEEQQFVQRAQANRAEQDELLTQLASGMGELREIALSMNKGLTLQNQMLRTVETKVEANSAQLQTATRRLTGILEASGGIGVWCPRLVCIVVLLALVVYLVGRVV